MIACYKLISRWAIGTIFFFAAVVHSFAQSPVGRLSGRVLEAGIPVQGVLVLLLPDGDRAVTDSLGHYELVPHSIGNKTLKITLLRARSLIKRVTVTSEAQILPDYTIKTDALNLSEVVVSASRTAITRQEMPVMVQVVSSKTFRAVQANTLAEGLSFTPGLRLENNCQNCGFTDVRLNGLQGPYSQILINSRPVFSALTAVYGLEQIPAAMVEKVEVVRGGGSVLYGGNAIAGTINIITRQPRENLFELNSNTSLIGNRRLDQVFSGYTSRVDSTGKKGYSLFGMHRSRQWYDHNGDGYSDMTQLRNLAFGGSAFYTFSKKSNLQISGQYLEEYRRGGNKFELEPHQTDITEQLRSRSQGLALTWDLGETDDFVRSSLYASYQFTARESYYGGGGRLLAINDSLTQTDILAINAYGNTRDHAWIAGNQWYIGHQNQPLRGIFGIEVRGNQVKDEMLGYGRTIDQSVVVPGAFAQIEYQPIEALTFTGGLRQDWTRVYGRYQYSDTLLNPGKRLYPVWVPRLTALWKLNADLKFRASFAQGYRAPQAFSEDLHIETVGGAARFVRLADNLKLETSQSYNASLDYFFTIDNSQWNLIVEGFHTRLDNPFINADPVELPGGISQTTKRNGLGSRVYGSNAELNTIFDKHWSLQSGFTIQRARYDQAELIWQPSNPEGAGLAPTLTRNILRTPNHYGFASLNYKPDGYWSLVASGVWTGPMYVAHTIDAESEYTVIKRTPSFLDITLKISRKWALKNEHYVETWVGCYNLLNQFQKDLDRGASRDANYIYGPLRPQSLFFGLRFGKM